MPFIYHDILRLLFIYTVYIIFTHFDFRFSQRNNAVLEIVRFGLVIKEHLCVTVMKGEAVSENNLQIL